MFHAALLLLNVGVRIYPHTLRLLLRLQEWGRENTASRLSGALIKQQREDPWVCVGWCKSCALCLSVHSVDAASFTFTVEEAEMCACVCRGGACYCLHEFPSLWRPSCCCVGNEHDISEYENIISGSLGWCLQEGRPAEVTRSCHIRFHLL